MASSLSSADRRRLNQALASWQHWPVSLTSPPQIIRALGGASNTNVLVTADEREFVVRLNRDSVHLGVDRAVERQVLTDISDRWFAPPVVYVGDTFLVTTHIHGGGGDLDPPALAALLKDIHDTPARVTATLNPVPHALEYLKLAGDLPAPLQPVVRRALAAPVPETTSPRLCHLDLSPQNIIVTSDRPIVIDWEYARLAHPAFDIAVVIESFAMSESDADLLIEHYGIDKADVRRMRQLYLLIEGLWWNIVGQPAPHSWRRLEVLLR